ncbi:hypothetical protein VSS74_12190 [Conexibacter stalactiti]|uniref:Ribbon-helix-helix protein CopG domain-containing protein n=1 Tax=Conexibacter stalactiti TaxID=1940611 RepID=A0ABU4HP64_9ACTN|nr:hypothetical protein [Conexibacter stalactiti]MDW5595103.1 hypothetical protein [Conexibacter stalactiti]MEC5035745.1 hypothetical protein [Conexibacter stalactiti]
MRFDADSWSRIGAKAERVGLSRAAFIRDAARAEIVRAEASGQLGELAARVDRVGRGLLVVRAAQSRQSRPRGGLMA